MKVDKNININYQDPLHQLVFNGIPQVQFLLLDGIMVTFFL
jgi:hypothetical protein